jgi:nucleotide-binding universal stress UspA family protein
VIGHEPASEGRQFHRQIAASTAAFAGPFAVTIARGIDREEIVGLRPNILVPVTGTATSRRGAEFAITLAQASRGSVTALHFVPKSQRLPATRSWQREVGAAIAPVGSADAVIREIVRLGDPYGVAVRAAVQSAGTSQDAILHQIKSGRHNLVVMGVSLRPGEQLDFGQTAAALLDKAECSLMFVVSEQPTTGRDTCIVGAQTRQQ